VCNNAIKLINISTARDAAKQDLKRQLVAFNVRKSIAAHILTTLQVPNASDFATSVAQHSVSHASTTRPETPAQENFAQSTALDSSHPPATDTAPVEPLYISTPRELEDLFRAMHPAFEDRESEDNWKIRDSNVLKIRRILRGNAPQEFMSALLAGIKDLLDGILKVVNSLRTTMSTMGCQLVQDLANILGTAIDPMVEILLRGLEKMSAATKHIAAQNANVTVDTILLRVSYHARLMQHILLASGDKNVQPRQFASGWLKTILRKQIQNKGQFEHSGGLDLAEKTIKKGLNDANPKVRENMRSAYWMFTQAWPDKGES
jgi:CLIP-associating protein 1/2